MKNIKVVTICGSMKFKKEMMQIAEKLELKEDYAVIQCIYGKIPKNIILQIKKNCQRYILKK